MNNFLHAFYYFITFLGILLIHYLMMKFGFQRDENFTAIYIFTSATCGIMLWSIAELDTFFHKYLGFIFIGFIAVKLIAAKIFMNQFETIDEPVYKYSFIVLYLISLVLITTFTAKLLLKPEK